MPGCVNFTEKMSMAEILDELSRLSPAELETVHRRIVELHQGRTVEASMELLTAIDAADKSFENEGAVSVDEARRIAASWNKK